MEIRQQCDFHAEKSAWKLLIILYLNLFFSFWQVLKNLSISGAVCQSHFSGLPVLIAIILLIYCEGAISGTENANLSFEFVSTKKYGFFFQKFFFSSARESIFFGLNFFSSSRTISSSMGTACKCA